MRKILNLKNILLIRGVKLEHLAKDTGIDLNRLTKYLNGEHIPSASTLHKLSLALYVSEAALYCDEDLWYERCLVEYCRPVWDPLWSKKKKNYWKIPENVSMKGLREAC